MEASAQTPARESLEALIGRLPVPEVDRDALALIADRGSPEARWLARRLHGRRANYRRKIRELFPGMELLGPPLAAGLGARARKCLGSAGIRGWGELGAATLIAPDHIPEAGAGTVEEILLLAMSE